MLNAKKIIVVFPAYNAEQTLRRTIAELPETVDERILVDDGSSDHTVSVAQELGLRVFTHDRNYGYGRNQQTCYREALAAGADVVVMLHPDYQYAPELVTPLASMISSGVYDVALGSRILGGGALQGGMPKYKYLANRVLTGIQNLASGAKLSEYHTGFRAFSRDTLAQLPLLENSDDFLFDNEMIAQCLYFGLRVGEISCPARYFSEASSIGLRRSLKYGIGVVGVSCKYLLQRLGLGRFRIFSANGRRLGLEYYSKVVPGTSPR